jgi:large subunit ribosomal protein L4
MKIDIYNKDGKQEGKMELSDAVFGVDIKESVVHKVYLAQINNARQPWAHTKDRSDVSGGGRKPWRQKGTGRARHGSIRSPIWKGGGVTFGPRNTQNSKQKVNKKTNVQAVKMCLSDKVHENKLIVIDGLVSNGKTKQMAELRNLLPGAGKTTVVLSAKDESSLNRATRNIPKLDLQRAIDVNVVDLLNHQYVITNKEGVKVLEDRLGKQTEIKN